MTVEITEVKITEDAIVITANDLEGIFLAENLYEEMEAKEVKFEFEREKEGHMKYLYKIVMGQRKTASAKSLGKKIEQLTGCITQISETFLQ